MSERVYIFRLWIRVWHWLNAALILLLIASGFSLHYAGSSSGLIGFGLARKIHNVAGIALCAAYAIFFVGNIVSGNWLQYVPRTKDFSKRSWLQVRYYIWDIFQGAPEPFPVTPENNFNPLQQVTYWGVMYVLMPMLIATGLVFLYPRLAPDSWLGVDGLLPIALTHFVVGYALFLFLLSHLYLITMGKKVSSAIKTMITGWHEDDG
jgi:thiosulfate reductase cytochrome b subunit